MMIPRQIFQTWKTKNVPELMEKAMSSIKTLNPEYNYQLFDDDDCRAYLQTHFPEQVVEAFNSVIPGAFKSDIWRYAVLFREGGVYIDADFQEFVPLSRILQPSDTFVSVKDRIE